MVIGSFLICLGMVSNYKWYRAIDTRYIAAQCKTILETIRIMRVMMTVLFVNIVMLHDRHGVSNNQQIGHLFNILCMLTTKKASMRCISGFPWLRDGNVTITILWCTTDFLTLDIVIICVNSLNSAKYSQLFSFNVSLYFPVALVNGHDRQLRPY